MVGADGAVVRHHRLVRLGGRDTDQGRAATEELHALDLRDSVVARLRVRVCARCRTGRILDIWVERAWQRQGVGRELVEALLLAHPGHRWTTTRQTVVGRVFFTAMHEETDVPFPPGLAPCPRLGGRLGQALGRRPVCAARKGH
jgi:GNAT superfamily N-acetyltransferase